jgi:hypothetical protein
MRRSSPGRWPVLEEFSYLQNNINNLEDSLKDNWEIRKLFHAISHSNLHLTNNNNLIIWGYKHSSFKNRWIQGFYKDNYSEFLIELNNLNLESKGICDDELMTNFEIGNVKVTISPPSMTFKLLFGVLNHNIVESGWNYYITISFKGLPKSEVNNHLQQALFLLEKYNPNCFIFGGSNNIHTSPNACDIIDTPVKIFPVSKHIDALCLYNEAINATRETCFYYFYRAIEYFFPVNQEIEILREINFFVKDIQNQDKDMFVSCLIDLCSKDEEKNLKHLLNNKDILDKVIWFTDSYSDKDDYENAINKFAKKLYEYRNKVVHSKESTRRIPNLLETVNEIDDWNEIVQEISLICIEHFCYENKITS